LHAVIERVRDVDVLVGIEGDTGRAVELPRAVAVLAPLAQELALPAELRDSLP
jgi:hypothetical protein